MSGSVDISARPIAEAGNFRRRHDGDWDYFIRLYSPTGYHVTLVQRESLERLAKIEHVAGWVLAFFVVTIGQLVGGRGVKGGSWIIGLGAIAWGLIVIAHRLAQLWILRGSARVSTALSQEEIEAIEDAAESLGAATILGIGIAGGFGNMIGPLLKQAGVHGPVAWLSAIVFCIAVLFALAFLWFGLRRRFVDFCRKILGWRRS